VGRSITLRGKNRKLGYAVKGKKMVGDQTIKTWVQRDGDGCGNVREREKTLVHLLGSERGERDVSKEEDKGRGRRVGDVLRGGRRATGGGGFVLKRRYGSSKKRVF